MRNLRLFKSTKDNQGFNLSKGRPQKRGPVVQPGILVLSSSGPKNVRFANHSRSRHRKVAGSNPARSTNAPISLESSSVRQNSMDSRKLGDVSFVLCGKSGMAQRPNLRASALHLG